jgi:hypothetical protein
MRLMKVDEGKWMDDVVDDDEGWKFEMTTNFLRVRCSSHARDQRRQQQQEAKEVV